MKPLTVFVSILATGLLAGGVVAVAIATSPPREVETREAPADCAAIREATSNRAGASCYLDRCVETGLDCDRAEALLIAVLVEEQGVRLS